MRFLFNLLFISLFTCLSAQAQLTLSGQITDAASGTALVGATVSDGRSGALSDAEGNFKLSGLKPGIYTFSFSFVGYHAKTLQLKLTQDTTLHIRLQEDPLKMQDVEIFGIREYPVTSYEIEKATLEKQNLGQDLPILMQFSPSVVSTSDAGAGVGYTGMRVRGSDASRTNVTINGIPVNDAESHGVFWVNMPDFASSVERIQIQRGVGTSTNGAGAFGASVNLNTEQASEEAYAETSQSYGSFNTWRHSLSAGTGRIADYFKVDTRLSKITSDGFIDNAWSDLKSFYVSGSYDRKRTNLTLNVFSGKERTFQAWNGVPQEQLEAGNRTFNELSGYDNEIDNYQQDHYQLILNQGIGQHWHLNTALHYTRGRGYFEQFRASDDLSDYALEPVQIGGETIHESDLIRRRWLDNHFYGAVWNLNYDNEDSKFNFNFGGGANRYEGKHFGEVIWAQFASNGEIRHRYYDNDAVKTDLNVYGKVQRELFESFSAFLDLQVRQVGYEFLGFNNAGENVTQNVNLTFFNPKFGVKYQLENHEFYASYARGNKEPNRDDFTESSPTSRPTHETLDNLEAGWSGRFGKVQFNANYYLMQYKNQLILTGQINDVGAYVRANVPDSYRTGIELSAFWQANEKLSWEANATFSQNKIRDFVEYRDSYAADWSYEGQTEIRHGDTDIALSPNFIAASQLNYSPVKGLEISLLSKFVGEQFLDNTSNDARKLDAYNTQDIRLRYSIPVRGLRSCTLSLLINNALDAEYESNGYTWGYDFDGQAEQFNYFYPQAGRNFLIGITLGI